MDLENYNNINFEDVNPYLEFEEEDEFLEWYSIEGKNQIFELSRQLRTFLNYKKSMLHLRFSRNQIAYTYLQEAKIRQYERALNESSSQLVSLLKNLPLLNGDLSNKINNLISKTLENSQNQESKNFIEISKIINKIWELLHVLSELEVQHYPRLFNRILIIASIACEIKHLIFPLFSEYFLELKEHYRILEKEISVMKVAQKKVIIQNSERQKEGWVVK